MSSNHFGGGRIGRARTHRTKRPPGSRMRRLGFESLEFRRMLATVATPTSVTVEAPPSGQGSLALTSDNNSSTSRELTFEVAGVTPGDTVNVYADGGTTPVATSATAVPTGQTTITVTSNGNYTLQDGSHTFTATQTDTLNDVSASSPASASVQVFADLTLTQTAVSATVGVPFSFAAATNAPSGDTPTIAAGSTLLPNMTFAANTFSGWTPTSSEVGTTQTFTVTLSDSIGNSTTVPVFVSVAATSGLSVFTPPTSVVVGSPVLVAFNDANPGTPNYSVTTSNPSDTVGDDHEGEQHDRKPGLADRHQRGHHGHRAARQLHAQHRGPH